MIRVRLQIGDGQVRDTYDEHRLIYLSADNRLAPPVKGMDTTSYPEEDGEHINPRTVYDAFDYKVKFLVSAESGMRNANQIVSSFNSQLFSTDEESGVKRFNRVVFYNDYKRVKITGIPGLISEPEELWIDNRGQQSDYAVVEWTIRVDRPQDCDFNMAGCGKSNY